MPGGCNFDLNFCNWTNEALRDDFDWIRRSGRTPSSKTGPSEDRAGEGRYIQHNPKNSLITVPKREEEEGCRPRAFYLQGAWANIPISVPLT